MIFISVFYKANAISFLEKKRIIFLWIMHQFLFFNDFYLLFFLQTGEPASSGGTRTGGTESIVATPTSIISSEGGRAASSDVTPLGGTTEGGSSLTIADLPEMEIIELQLAKDHQGLGITIAGYVCERGNFIYLVYHFITGGLRA